MLSNKGGGARPIWAFEDEEIEIMQTATVKYHVATYDGEEKVFGVDPDDENERVIARARQQVTRKAGGSLPYGSESWKVVSRVDND